MRHKLGILLLILHFLLFNLHFVSAQQYKVKSTKWKRIEVTSALDAKTEYELVKAVKDRGITCIVIAHRLSTIRDCDEIIVLDKGVVVERGTHEELYAKGGVYTELIASD